jgi:phage terminase small subunit
MATTPIKSYQGTGVDELSDREYRFVEGYVIHLDGQRAAVEAGYKPTSARSQAARLLSRTKIRRVIGVLKRRGLAKAELTQQQVLEQLKHCVTRTSDDYLDEDGKLKNHADWNERAKAALDGIKQRVRTLKDENGNVIGEEVETEIKLVAKGGAIATAMRHFADQLSSDDLTNRSIDWDEMYQPQNNPAARALLELERKTLLD